MLNIRLYFLRVIGFAAFVGIAVSASGAGQSTASGQISGAVRGPGREAVRGAIVLISSHDGRIQRTTRSNAVGGFVFLGLPAGSYTMQSCAEQLGPSTSANVELRAGMEAIQDLSIRANIAGVVKGACSPDSIVSPAFRDIDNR